MRHTAQHALWLLPVADAMPVPSPPPSMTLDELATVALRYAEVSEWLLAYIEVVAGRPGRN